MSNVLSILTAGPRLLLRCYRWWGARAYEMPPHADDPFRVPTKPPGYDQGPGRHSPHQQANIEASKHRVHDHRNGWFR